MSAVNTETVGRPLDQSVARAKFDEQLALYRQSEADYHESGCWLLSAAFPYAYFAFAQPKMTPTGVILSARFDFSNYDLLPISVKFISPFTRLPVPAKSIFYHMWQRAAPAGGQLEIPGQISGNPLVQAQSPEETPFLCVPGVLEYHLHPGHSGDPWWLHRAKGEGTLAHLLGIFVRYAINPVHGYNIQLMGVRIGAFQPQELPE